MKNIPRNEYPRPNMVRDEWQNLNGEWDFEIDNCISDEERRLFLDSEKLSSKIIVPFCPESKLSGVEHTDFIHSVWYKKRFEIPEKWSGRNIILHFGAVDYEAKVWVNEEFAGTHKGGYTPFKFDITRHLKVGKNTIVLCAFDDVRSANQPSGKQSHKLNSSGCYYTRTTGIWQTVYLECVDKIHIDSYKIITDIYNKSINIQLFINNVDRDIKIDVKASFDKNIVGNCSVKTSDNYISFNLALSTLKLWGIGSPNLYDLDISICDDEKKLDSIKGYFGMRNIKLRDKKILINDKAVFQRLVLDQGFYRDGIYTAPTDEALKNDIIISMEMGFNGARLHEKIFEPRYLYWADKLGYIVWGEHGNWGLSITNASAIANFLPEWCEALKRDFNHPSIVGWCPFNETWDDDKETYQRKGNHARQCSDVVRIIYNMTKLLDPTRPVIDTSGNFHVETDVYDIHSYVQDVDSFREMFDPDKKEMYESFPKRQKHRGQPYFVSEYGGIWWDPDNSDQGWGYGGTKGRPKSIDEFIARYKGLTYTLLDNKNICAFCYTQLYDVEQEVNGLYTYDRKPKFDNRILYKINTKKAMIEE